MPSHLNNTDWFIRSNIYAKSCFIWRRRARRGVCCTLIFRRYRAPSERSPLSSPWKWTPGERQDVAKEAPTFSRGRCSLSASSGRNNFLRRGGGYRSLLQKRSESFLHVTAWDTSQKETTTTQKRKKMQRRCLSGAGETLEDHFPDGRNTNQLFISLIILQQYRRNLAGDSCATSCILDDTQ